MAILIIDTFNILSNGIKEGIRKEVDTKKPKVYRCGFNYHFNSRVIKTWCEHPEKKKG